MKNALTVNLWPNMEQVILLYCHTILRKKALSVSFWFHFWEIILSRRICCLKSHVRLQRSHISGTIPMYLFTHTFAVALQKIMNIQLVWITFIWKTTKIWGLMLLLVVCYLQVLWNKFSVIIWPDPNSIQGPNSHISFIWMQSLQNVTKCFSTPHDQKISFTMYSSL